MLSHLTGGLTASLIGVGDRLGFYRVLNKLGKATSAELATASGTHERFTREWLHQQVRGRLAQVEICRSSLSTNRVVTAEVQDDNLLAARRKQ